MRIVQLSTLKAQLSRERSHFRVESALESGGALAVAENPRDARGRRQLRAAIDRRHREVELRAFGAAGQHDANRMKEGFTLLTRPGLHTVRRLAKFFAVEPWRRRQLLGERADDRPRALAAHLVERMAIAERRLGVVAKEKREPRRHLLQAIHR